MRINYHSSVLWSIGVKIQISLYISPSSGLFFISPDEDLLFEVETSRVNFLVSFNSDDQRNTDVATTADVTTYEIHWSINYALDDCFNIMAGCSISVLINNTVTGRRTWGMYRFDVHHENLTWNLTVCTVQPTSWCNSFSLEKINFCSVGVSGLTFYTNKNSQQKWFIHHNTRHTSISM